MNQSNKPSVDGLMRLAMNMAVMYRGAPLGFPGNCLADYDVVKAELRAGIERLAALAGPLEQPQEPKSDKANLAQASGVCDLQTALPRWIPVSEKLPKYGQTVLAFFPPLVGTLICGANFSTAMFASATHWHNPEDDEDDYAIPSHWMPLPPAPGESAGSARSDKPAASSESSLSVPKEQQ